MPPHPIHLVVTDDLKRWRLTVALRWLLALPHLFVLTAWTYVALPVTLVNWFITLVRGRPSTGVHAWASRFIRYQAHVNAYVYLVADPYPSFRGWPGRYPVDLAIAPPTDQVRWKTLLRIVLVIPAYVFATVLGYVLFIVAFIGAFYALATGRYPKRLPRPQCVLPALPGADVRLPASSHGPVPDARERLAQRYAGQFVSSCWQKVRPSFCACWWIAVSASVATCCALRAFA